MMNQQQTIPGTAPKVEASTIDSLMASLVYHVARVPGTTTTLAAAFLPSGFNVASGESYCVSAENFDAQTGIDLAIDAAKAKARDKLWEFEGYALAKQLAEPKRTSAGGTTWQERLIAEEAELGVRIAKLTDFLEAPPANLGPYDFNLLVAQVNAQNTLRQVLRLRLDAANLL